MEGIQSSAVPCAQSMTIFPMNGACVGATVGITLDWPQRIELGGLGVVGMGEEQRGEGQRERQRQRKRQTQRKRDRETGTETEGQRETERQRQEDIERQT